MYKEKMKKLYKKGNIKKKYNFFKTYYFIL